MTLLSEILRFNQAFVDNKGYLPYQTEDKFPDKNVVMLTCMDARLVELSLKSLNLSNGDVKVVKNAGAIINHPFGSAMRSILVAIYELKADEVIIMGHHDCGMSHLNADTTIDNILARGISQTTLDTLENAGINLSKWLVGFDSVEDSVRHSVDLVQKHPLLPSQVPVHGLVIHPETGKLDLIINGYDTIKSKSTK